MRVRILLPLPKDSQRKLRVFSFCHGSLIGIPGLLFGKYADLSAVRGLQSGVPALLLQGSEDREVPCGGCSLYARRAELPGADFRLITDPASNQHMTVIRQAGQSGVNRDTMALVDKFLDRLF